MFYRLDKKSLSDKRKEEGFIVVVLFLLATFVLIFVFALMLVLMPNGKKSQSMDVGAKTVDKETHNDPNSITKETNNSSKDGDTHQDYKLPEDEQDLSTGYLVCVNLPGVAYPRTPALDVRVARRYLAVKQLLDEQGIPTVRFSWAFRSNCQQVNVKPSGSNPKAKPGSSPHEAGRALDVVGLDPSSPAFRKNDWSVIVRTFESQGWRWLGKKDPPHMDIQAFQVGEPSNAIWIQKAQTDFNRGGPKGGCRGSDCGQ